MQEVCIADAEALSRLLPAEPCLAEGCNCQSDGDCPGENGRYAICDFNQIEIMGTCFSYDPAFVEHIFLLLHYVLDV